MFDWEWSDECDFDPLQIQQLVASIHPHNRLCNVICCMFGMMCLLLTRQEEEEEKITTDWQIYKNVFFSFRFYCAILLLLFSPHRNHQTIELSICGVDNTSWQMFALFHVANGNANEYVRIQIDKLTGWLWRLKTDFHRLEKLQTIFCAFISLSSLQHRGKKKSQYNNIAFTDMMEVQSLPFLQQVFAIFLIIYI